MKYFELTDSEKDLVKGIDAGEFATVKDKGSEIERYQEIAASTLNKTKNINIRLSEKDIQKLKVKAVETGIPYQTLVSSILHRFVNKKDDFAL